MLMKLEPLMLFELSIYVVVALYMLSYCIGIISFYNNINIESKEILHAFNCLSVMLASIHYLCRFHLTIVVTVVLAIMVFVIINSSFVKINSMDEK